MEDGAAESKTGSSSVSSSEAPRTPNTELKKLLLFKVYKRRWFVLLVLCLLNCSNATLWLTFAPVADRSAKFLGVSLEKINWLSVVYMVVAIPLSFGSTWMLDTLGLPRICLILGAWLNMFGALLRFIGASVYPEGPGFTAKYLLVMSGQTLGAMAQPLFIFTPTKVAAHWFPDHQRATANIASMSGLEGFVEIMEIEVFLLQHQRTAVAVVCSLFGFFGFSIYPVAMELSVECSYPVGEATSAGLLFVSGQIQSVLFIVLLQSLTKRLTDSPLSTCGDIVLSWKVPLMLMAGLCTFFSCCFVIFFNTRYRRLEAEEQAVYGTKPRAASTGSKDAPSVQGVKRDRQLCGKYICAFSPSECHIQLADKTFCQV
ncbi:solute carrier family 49 member A3-like [Cyclopterus lumpus]|uniref:solute carrier family 49 member A3-like n=1 Tax=Cyclopterus lumpus TaxID=8103 RepID=UPI0014861B3F|nr:solute carrier family 49 member A3-like [Cyclopterus lumpus]